MRYKELKLDGKIITQKYKIEEQLIKYGFNWFLDCEIEDMRIEILKDTLIINEGVYYNGDFVYGVIRNIDWKNGEFTNGVIYGGTFKRCLIRQGLIFGGTFIKGEILFADIRGGDFVDIKISDNCVKDIEPIEPIKEMKYLKNFNNYFLDEKI